MKRKIMFVDDEKTVARGYLDALEKDFDVSYVSDCESAWQHMKKNMAEEKAVVLDVMMPWPEGIDAETTAHGFETGLWLLERFRDQLAVWPFPVVVLTNRSTELIREGIQRREIDPTRIVIRRKIETPAFTLPKIVRSLIARFE